MMKVLVSEKILDEVNISDKNKERFLDAGTSQNVYASKIGNTVIKFPKYNSYDESELEEYSFMMNHPKYFPKIYKLTKNYAMVEKLDTTVAKKEFTELSSSIYTIFNETFMTILRKIYQNSKSGLKNDLTKYKKELQEEYPTFERFVVLIENIAKLKDNHFSVLDAHAGNFAYDKDGNLKMIDI